MVVKTGKIYTKREKNWRQKNKITKTNNENKISSQGDKGKHKKREKLMFT